MRIQLLTRDSKMLFNAPMLLITNKRVINEDQALKIYSIYLKRSKIEGVFKLLKDVLGWEESQIREFAASKTLLIFCYFIAGYFYEIEAALVEKNIIKFMAYLGDEKGRITRTYVLRELSKLMTKWKIDNAIAAFKMRKEQIEKMIQVGMYSF